LLLLVCGAAIYQGVWLTDRVAVPNWEAIWPIRNLPAWQRSAILVDGEELAGYLGFLRANIPEDARVILPPLFPQRPVAHVGLMQYYLFPRDIHNCGFGEVEECTLRVVGAHTYIIGLPDFPPVELALRSKRYIPYRDGLGVFAPK
jgi:hypothetical protein